jgi:hypothetical protein
VPAAAAGEAVVTRPAPHVGPGRSGKDYVRPAAAEEYGGTREHAVTLAGLACRGVAGKVHGDARGAPRVVQAAAVARVEQVRARTASEHRGAAGRAQLIRARTARQAAGAGQPIVALAAVHVDAQRVGGELIVAVAETHLEGLKREDGTGHAPVHRLAPGSRTHAGGVAHDQPAVGEPDVDGVALSRRSDIPRHLADAPLPARSDHLGRPERELASRGGGRHGE